LGEALREKIKEKYPIALDTMSDFDNEKYLQRKADEENEQEGNLKGIDCLKCKNRGHISIVKDGEIMWQMCECNKARKSLLLIEQSGLKPLLDEYTFEKYDAIEPWQKNALSMAQNFVEYGEGNWLFFGGMSGSGKSHLCTAICGELLKRGKAVKYMMWKDEATKLKSLITESNEYGKLIDELKSVDVLYIDDFLKVQRGKQPTEADVNLAFEILNYRYANKSLTLISTEKTIDEIISLDDALGGRIYQMSKNYSMNIAYDKNKNFRLRK
jgi:DNA replication protein DnaC